MRIALEQRHLDRRYSLHKLVAIGSSPSLASLPSIDHGAAEIVVRRAAPHRRAEVDAVVLVKAALPDSVSGDPAAIAGRAERSARRGDDAECATVSEGIATRGSRPGCGNGDDRAVAAAKCAQDLFSVDDCTGRPSRRSADVHVFDEPELCVNIRAEPEEVCEFAVVDAAHDNGVDLRTTNPEIAQKADALEHLGQVIALCDRSEARPLQRVDADRDSPKAGGEQLAGEATQQDAVRGQSKIADGWVGGEQAYEPHDVPSQQRFSASDPNLVDPSVAYTSATPPSFSMVRRSWRGSHRYSGSGMQYMHRKLHRSMMDIRRSRIGGSSRSRTVASDEIADKG